MPFGRLRGSDPVRALEDGHSDSPAGESGLAGQLFPIRPSPDHLGHTTSTVRLRITSSLPGRREAAEGLSSRRQGESVRVDERFHTLCCD
jgi:hypothetical protein